MTHPSNTEQAAIDAMKEAWSGNVLTATGNDLWLTGLRAIPLDYCVQRAINEGALAPMGILWRPSTGNLRWSHRLHRDGRSYPRDAEMVDVYRLASENET